MWPATCGSRGLEQAGIVVNGRVDTPVRHSRTVVVTDANKIVGLVSAYDLLQLVEDHRFVAKRGPTPSKKGQRRR